jgi:hypothetical protein
MKNLYRPLYQKVLLFCVLLLGCQLTFAQTTLPDPTGVTPSQIVCYDESITLTGTCAEGDLKWYDGEFSTTEVTILTFNVTETVTYFAACVSSCTCSMSNSVPVTLTVNKPFNVSRDQSVCDCESVTLKASCPRGVVTWYGLDTSTFLGTGSSYTDQPGGNFTYNVRCEDAVNSCNSPLTAINVYQFHTLNDPPTVMSDTIVCSGSGLILRATCNGDAQPFFYLDDEITEIDSVVNNITSNMIYKVRCESLSACNSIFSSINVSVSAPGLPADVIPEIEICRGDTFLLEANCDADFEAVWYLDDETTPFPYLSTTPSDEVTYKVRCESTVIIGCNSGFVSTTITLKTDITAQPSSVLVCIGDMATFTVGVTGMPTFQWQKKQADGTFIDIPLATSETLILNSTVLADAGFYRCHIVGDCNFYTEEVFLAFPQSIIDKGRLVPPQVAVVEGYANASAISDSLAVVGAYGKNNGKGAAYIFKMNPNGKWTQVAQLAPSELQVNDMFGYAVAITGNDVFVSALGQDDFEGSVYIFRKQSNNTWLQIRKLKTPGGALPDDYFGGSLSASDSLLAIGTDGYERTFVYRDSLGVWVLEKEIYDGEFGNEFGYSVGIAGNTLVVGAPSEGASGAVFIYERMSPGIWNLKGQFTPAGLAIGADFGFAAAISGNSIIASGEEMVQIYEKDDVGNWSEKASLDSDDLGTDVGFGFSVAIHDNTVVIGVPWYANYKGAAVVYQKNVAGNWVKKKTLTPTDLASGDQFGASVTISGNSLLVGASFEPTSFDFRTGGSYFYSLYTHPVPTVSAIAQVSAICPSLAATFNLTGLPIADTYTITYKIDIDGPEKNIVLIPDTTGKASFTEILSYANNTKNIYITRIKSNTTNCEQVINVFSAITVKAPTIITGHPESQTVCVGETAVFMTEATGEGLLTFQWQRQAPATSGINGPITNDFSDISVLTLQSRTLADNGARYRAKVTGECGMVVSNDALLTVLAKATASIATGGPICPGTTASLSFTGTPFAEVFYHSNGTNTSVTLDAGGNATITTPQLTSQTTYNLISINVEGKCSQSLSGSATVEVLTAGINPPLTLTSPVHDVLPNGKQTHAAQTIDASNKVEAGGKATYIGNKSVIMQPGFEAKQGSIYTAKITAACI